METQAKAAGDHQTARAAAEAVAPDALTAAILEKQARNEPLTPQESGKLGAFRAMLKRASQAVGWKPGAAVSAPGPIAGPAGNAPLGQMAPCDAPGDRMALVPIDPDLGARTTNAILTKGNSAAVRWVHKSANACGVTGKELTDLLSASNLSKDDRALIADLAPAILEKCRVDPFWFAIGTIGGVLGLHAVNLYQAVEAIRESRQAPPAEPPSRTATADQPMPPRVTQPGVKRPPDISLPKGPLAFPGGGSGDKL